MFAVEFQATIENGIVHIPEQFLDLQQKNNATFIVMYNDDSSVSNLDNNSVEKLEELFSKSNNKISVNMKIATEISGMIDDGIF